MNRLYFLILPFLFLLGQLGLAKTKPNLIYVVCDDLGYGDLGCYGQR